MPKLQKCTPPILSNEMHSYFVKLLSRRASTKIAKKFKSDENSGFHDILKVAIVKLGIQSHFLQYYLHLSSSQASKSIAHIVVDFQS